LAEVLDPAFFQPPPRRAGSRVDNLYLQIMANLNLAGKPHPLGKSAGVQAYRLIQRGLSGVATRDPDSAQTACTLAVTTRTNPDVRFIEDIADRMAHSESYMTVLIRKLNRENGHLVTP
jgi:hypothetical protein